MAQQTSDSLTTKHAYLEAAISAPLATQAKRPGHSKCLERAVRAVSGLPLHCGPAISPHTMQRVSVRAVSGLPLHCG